MRVFEEVFLVRSRDFLARGERVASVRIDRELPLPEGGAIALGRRPSAAG